VTAGAVARWDLTVRPRRSRRRHLIPNGNRRTGLLPEPDPVPAPVLRKGEFVVAGPGRRSPWADIADVIICPQPPCSPGGGAGGDLLANYPGCVVAVAGGPRCCVMAVRDGTVIRVALTRGSPSLPTGCPGASSPPWLPGFWAMAGCLAHAWLVAGLPLAALDGSRPQVAASDQARRWETVGQVAAAAFSLSMKFAALEMGGQPFSRARTWSASGASMAS
jgi:hypothetical protein